MDHRDCMVFHKSINPCCKVHTVEIELQSCLKSSCFLYSGLVRLSVFCLCLRLGFIPGLRLGECQYHLGECQYHPNMMSYHRAVFLESVLSSCHFFYPLISYSHCSKAGKACFLLIQAAGQKMAVSWLENPFILIVF